MKSVRKVMRGREERNKSEYVKSEGGEKDRCGEIS